MSKREYQMCECPQANYSCCGGRGPAVFEVERDGKKLKLCTRCDLSSDKNRKLIIDEKYDANTLIDFDPIGAFVVIGEMATAPTNDTESMGGENGQK